MLRRQTVNVHTNVNEERKIIYTKQQPFVRRMNVKLVFASRISLLEWVIVLCCDFLFLFKQRLFAIQFFCRRFFIDAYFDRRFKLNWFRRKNAKRIKIRTATTTAREHYTHRKKRRKGATKSKRKIVEIAKRVCVSTSTFFIRSSQFYWRQKLLNQINYIFRHN